MEPVSVKFENASSPKRARVALVLGASAVILVVVAGGSILLNFLEPSVDGAPASFWVTQLGASQPQADRATTALDKLGEKAIPFLIATIGCEPQSETFLQRFGRQVYVWAPGWLRPLLPAPRARQASEIQHARTQASYYLGSLVRKAPPLANLAIPGLQTLLRHTNAEIRFSAALALTGFGTNARPILGTVGEILRTDPVLINDPLLVSVEHCGPQANVLVPALQDVLAITNLPRRMSIARTLWSLDHSQADLVRPIALAFTKSADAGNRIEAASLLWRMDGDPQVVVPTLVGLLQDADQAFDYRTLRMLKAIGPAAKAAVPALTRWLESPQPRPEFVTRTAIEALQQIRQTQTQ
jgi:hypothetical protein